ncbi:MAG: ribosomal protein S18-alanine N-acetyltransferase [Clostridiales bacterium]|nr:ribosomal protein S18-alanine N-acetyltransferase [Clostridiales bacterium]
MAEALVRRMTLDDVERVSAIEAEAFPRPWTAADFRHELTENKVARYLVVEEAGEVAAFAGVHVIIDQGHVTNIAVAEQHRGKGYGRLVTAALMQYAANLGATYLTLEVRASNQAAQNLYASLGFIKVSVRKRYYEDTGEDAWLMACDQLPAADPDFEEPETVYED